MTQTRERRMYLMYKSRKRSGGEWYAEGLGCSPLMAVARRFGVPVREVREIIDAQRPANGMTCRSCGQPGARRRLHPYLLEIDDIRSDIIACDACNERIADDI